MRYKPGLAIVLAAQFAAVGLALPAGGAAEKEKGGWKDLFDGKTLDGWKAADFTGGGKVSVKDGAAVMEKGRNMTGLTYTRGDFPKVDYEVSLEGKKLDGEDFFCTTTFPVGDSFCSLVVGGWGGGVVGLSSLNSQDASENETSTRREFQRDRWYPVRIRVTKDRIVAWIEEEKVVDVETEGKKVGIRSECGPCKPFGFATWNTVGAVRKIRVRALTEAEKKAPGGTKSGDKD
jgi:hypothetical protein